MNTTSAQKLPEAVAYMPRIIEALRDMDGIAKAGAVKEWIVATMAEKNQPISDTMLDSGVPKYQNDIQWARMYLVNGKMLEPVSVAGHGNWMLTKEGLTTSLDKDTMTKVYFLTAKKGKKASTDTQTAPGDDDTQMDIHIDDSWDVQLKKMLQGMHHQGFERLCAFIMTNNKLHSTKVTGQSGDKGIDGEGYLSFDALELVSIRVAWQCKRFKDGTVGSEAVRNFRGSLDHTTAHGIIFTTSAFTASAVQEANQPGKKPIKLVAFDNLINHLKTLGMGISTTLPHTVDLAYFDKFLYPMVDSSTSTLPFIDEPALTV